MIEPRLPDGCAVETCQDCGREFVLDPIRRKLPAPGCPFPICLACECRAFDLACLGGREGLDELVDYVIRESGWLRKVKR
jgi:hypothetical protein